MRILSKKQLRNNLNYSSRKVFNEHLDRTGTRNQLPEWFNNQYNFYGEQITILEGIFGKQFQTA